MSAIRINGIRVGHQMFHLRQYPDQPDAGPDPFHTFVRAKINLPCLGLEHAMLGSTVSCCFEGEVPPDTGLQHPCPATMISVYPHGTKTATLGALIEVFGKAGLPFFHMVSSSAMISFVMDEKNRVHALEVLEQTFDLPPTHTPYEPGFQEETAAFVKKRYQETRAYFQENRIKTYGFALETDLGLTALSCQGTDLADAGRMISALDTKFYFSCALNHNGEWHVYCLTQAGPKTAAAKGCHGRRVDLVTFHGPHFGDRFGIFNTAATCLSMAGLELMLAGCTGASVSLVLPAGQGPAALPALEKGFETP